jgi:hypothetical protein
MILVPHLRGDVVEWKAVTAELCLHFLQHGYDQLLQLRQFQGFDGVLVQKAVSIANVTVLIGDTLRVNENESRYERYFLSLRHRSLRD